MVAKKKSRKGPLSLEKGLRYPWVKGKRLWNILWALIPIIGWFALGGYVKKILYNVAKGRVNGLPPFGKFWKNVGEGFFLLVYMIPLMFVIMIVGFLPIIGTFVSYFGWIFVFPYLFMNVIVKNEFLASFDFQLWWDKVVGNFGEYLIAFLKGFAYGIVYLVLSLVLIGIPASVFGKNIFFADFYRRFS